MSYLALLIIIGTILTIVPLPHKSPQKTTKYRKYLRSYKWRKTRNKRLDIDNHTCKNCGSKVQLEVHHKTYKRIYREKMCDLITLCKSCHIKEHNKLKNKQ